MEKKQGHKDYGYLFYVHVILIVLYYLSPFLVNWTVVIVIAALMILQNIFIKGCVLTIAEFKEESQKTGFFHHYLKKIGIHLSRTTIEVISYILPFALIGTAILWQIVFQHKPLLF